VSIKIGSNKMKKCPSCNGSGRIKIPHIPRRLDWPITKDLPDPPAFGVTSYFETTCSCRWVPIHIKGGDSVQNKAATIIANKTT